MNQANERIPINFLYLVGNAGVSRFGVSTFNLVILWVLLYETHAPVLAGLGDGILSVPLFFSFVVGAIIDKSARKKDIAIVSSVIRAISVTSIFIALFFQNVLLLVLSIYVTGFVIGLSSDILNSVRAVWMKEFLSEAQYTKGSSLSQSAFSLAEGLGYISAGVFLYLGFQRTFLSIIAIFIISLIPLLLIVEQSHRVKDTINIRDSTWEGFAFIKGNRTLIQLIILMIFANFIFGMTGVVFTSLVQLHFKLQSEYLGYIFSLLVFGIAIGSLLAAKIRGKVGNILFPTLFILGSLTISIFLLNNIFLVMIPMFFMGLAIGIMNVGVSSAVLKIIPRDMMARTQGSFNTFGLGATAFAGIIGGVLVQLAGPLESFLYLGTGIVAVSLLILFFRELTSLVI